MVKNLYAKRVSAIFCSQEKYHKYAFALIALEVLPASWTNTTDLKMVYTDVG